jgi:hypothetical protein
VVLYVVEILVDSGTEIDFPVVTTSFCKLKADVIPRAVLNCPIVSRVCLTPGQCELEEIFREPSETAKGGIIVEYIAFRIYTLGLSRFATSVFKEVLSLR